MRWSGVTIIALCLFTPSVWMLAKIPPLWKDVDAYAQVTASADSQAILLYGPLSCFLPRVPLYFGYLFETLRNGSSPQSFLLFFAQPILTDAGVSSLIFFQHLALCLSATFLILSANRRFAARLLLAVFWTLNPIFFAWANCVGSESLSLIFVLLLATVGLRIITRHDKVPLRVWSLFGLLLACCLLTRHINGLLAALLPLGFGFVALARFIAALRAKPERTRRWLNRSGVRALRNAIIAVAVGIVGIVLSSTGVHAFSRAVGLYYHNTAGFTFMFRLGFLAPLALPERDEVVEKAAARSSAEVRTLLEPFRTAPAREHYDTMALLSESRTLLQAESPDAQSRFDDLLNQATRAFLFPPSRFLLHAAASDFSRSLQTSLASVTRHPFNSTTFFFRFSESMPLCAGLVTFRGHTAPDILGLVRHHAYLRWWKQIDFRALFCLWLAALAPLLFWRRSGRANMVTAYAIALILVGLLMMCANCLLNQFQARFILPLWELTIISMVALLGSSADRLLRMHKGRRADG